MNTYKFRAEGVYDVLKFFLELSPSTVTDFSCVVDAHAPDCEIVFTAKYTLEELKNILEKIPDSHVMLQTIALHEDYTGIR